MLIHDVNNEFLELLPQLYIYKSAVESGIQVWDLCCFSDPDVTGCVCSAGFYGETCQLRNPCWTEPCFNGATCFNSSDTQYTCQCSTGYQGNCD